MLNTFEPTTFPNRDVASTLECGLGRNDDLGAEVPEGHDREADDERGDAGRAGESQAPVTSSRAPIHRAKC